MLKFFLCLKYLRRKKIIILSIAAVAISCALLISVGSLFAGFINALENTANDFVGDVVLTPNGKIHDYDILIEKLTQNSQIEAATPVLSTQGLVHIDRGVVKGVSVWGIDPATRAKVTKIGKSLLLQNDPNITPLFNPQNSPDAITGFVSIGLLASPDPDTDKYDFDSAKAEFIEKNVVLTTGSMSASESGVKFSSKGNAASNFKVKKIPFTISDIVFAGIYQMDTRYIYLPIDVLSQKLYPENKDQLMANIIHIKLAADANPDEAVAAIWSIWSEFANETLGWGSFAISQANIETAKQMQAANAAELQKQMNMLLMIFGIVSTAVVLLIFCIFYMIVTTKIKDIAIIKSFGASAFTVYSIFLYYGMLIGIFGAGFGFLLGYYIIKHINQIEEWIRLAFGLKLWDSSIYLFTKTPDQIDYSTVKWVLPAAVISAIIGAIIPAISAARVKPVKILQYE
jgi:lipoprotein-releasing system permease protein